MVASQSVSVICVHDNHFPGRSVLDRPRGRCLQAMGHAGKEQQDAMPSIQWIQSHQPLTPVHDVQVAEVSPTRAMRATLRHGAHILLLVAAQLLATVLSAPSTNAAALHSAGRALTDAAAPTPATSPTLACNPENNWCGPNGDLCCPELECRTDKGNTCHKRGAMHGAPCMGSVCIQSSTV